MHELELKTYDGIFLFIQFLETGEESLAAVAGMFSSKAKGIFAFDTRRSDS